MEGKESSRKLAGLSGQSLSSTKLRETSRHIRRWPLSNREVMTEQHKGGGSRTKEWSHRNGARKTQAHLVLKLARFVMGNKKSFQYST